MDIYVITGASSGIGKALSIALAKKGKKILATARNIIRLQQLKAQYPNLIDIIAADVSTHEGRDLIVERLSVSVKIKALVNNAGVMVAASDLKDIRLEDWRYQMAVNVEAPLFLTTKLIPFLSKGRVLNISTYSSSSVIPGLGAYGISKASLNMLTSYLKAELFKYDIAVGTALPGIVNTSIQDNYFNLIGKSCFTNKFIDLKNEGQLLAPTTSAKFLTWLLLDLTPENFSEKIWDIYDRSHQHNWIDKSLATENLISRPNI